jgi:ANTAR domain/GAF domain
MCAEKPSRPLGPARKAALGALARSAADNIPGADFVSITVQHPDRSLRTVAATDPLAERADSLQYELREGPCVAAVTSDRFVMVDDVASAGSFPRYGPKAAALGVRAQAAIQLLHDGEHAGLNLYARSPGVFNPDTVLFSELFATQTAALLGYAEQVEQLSEALRTRTDIGTAVGILMQRHGIDQHRAFALLAKTSQNRNVKVKVLAHQVIEGTYRATKAESQKSHAVARDAGRQRGGQGRRRTSEPLEAPSSG